MKLRVALAQINPTVGDLAGNAALISKYTKEAQAASAMSLFFPRWF
jgi:NAD+ synthase (glutamine-hydrolysing)